MSLSEIFIKRPVMTTLLMLGITVFGVLGWRTLPVNQLPNIDFPTISVSAALPGANPDTMAATVAAPLERQFTTIAGIDSMNSSSSLGASSITLQFNLSRDIDSAAQDVQSAISAALPLLPQLPTRPSFRKVNPADAPILYLNMRSDTMPLSAVDEYAENVLSQRLSMVNGVAQVNVYGSMKFAVRVQVDPDKLADQGIGLDQVNSALQSGSVTEATGTLYGPHQVYNIQSNDTLFKAANYRPLIISYKNGRPVHLEDVADVLDSVANLYVDNVVGREQQVSHAITLAIQRQPNTNTVQVIDDCKAVLAAFQEQIPKALHLAVMYDRAVSIRQDVNDVTHTMMLTIVLVIMVIFFFLRNGTATLIPSLALPVSLIGTLAAMALLNFSLDDMSLMGMTLCVGLLVDDAIVMLENIVRHMEMGEERMAAAFKGSQEVGFTILSMTLSLVAVFIPILFMGGLIGRLFFEFAMTITVAILISGFVSLSLTPMMCSRFLNPPQHGDQSTFFRATEWVFDQMLGVYVTILKVVLRFKPLTMLISLGLLLATIYAAYIVPKGFIPRVDTGQISANTEAVQDISFASMKAHQRQIANIVAKDPNVAIFMSTVGAGGASSTMNAGRMFVTLAPVGKGPGQRTLDADSIIQELRRKVAKIPGIKLYMQNPPAIRIGGMSTKGLYQYTIQGLDTKTLYPASYELLTALKSVQGVQDVNSDLLAASLDLHLDIDRDKASLLGLTSQQIDSTLGEAYGTHQVSMIYTPADEFQLLLEVKPEFSNEPNLLSHLFVHGSNGRLTPISSLAHFTTTVQPLQVNHLGQLPSVTLSFNLAPDVSLGDAEAAIQQVAERTLPSGITGSFQGNALAFQASLSNMASLLTVAILVIYIVLGILYESFTHPITILAGLPSAGLGAILTLIIFHQELDIYGFLGMILLIGIVKKNAIMMIDRALETERAHHLTPDEAIYEACLVRFRPIMMTTMAALLGSVPLAIGMGAGSEARRPLGMAVVGGLIVSQMLTLFITPVYYIYIDRFTEWMTRKPSSARLPKRRFAALPPSEETP